MVRLQPRWVVGGAAASLLAATLGTFWPGVAMYDTVRQYDQVLSGHYDDWHPPAMARLWSLLAPLGPGAAPMLAVQLAGYWLGLGTLAMALIGVRRPGAGWAVLGVGLLPCFLGWQGVVLKDAQLVAALLALVGLIAWWRLRGVPLPMVARIAMAVLATYAVLVRANAVFAVVPLLAVLSPWPTGRVWRAAVAAAALVAVLALAPAINHHVLGADASGVERTQALYDLAGIAVRAPGDAAAPLTEAEAAAITRRGCVSPFFWDPLGDEAHCAREMARLRALPAGTLYAKLATAMLRHPLAYAEARSSHLNSTERWLVPAAWPNAVPPAVSEPNATGLGQPGAAARRWQGIAAGVVATPLGWPIAWVVVAMAALATALGRPRGAAGGLAIALLASALVLEASFAVLSIASDLRYHLWPMIATALAVVLLAERRPPARVLIAGATALLVIVAGGTVARFMLPAPPATYAGMLDASANSAISF